MKPAEAASIKISSGDPDRLHLDLLDPTGAVMARASMTRAVFARLLMAGDDAWPRGGFAPVAITFELSERDREGADPALEAAR